MHPDYRYRAGLAVACQGLGSGIIRGGRGGPAGPRRQRTGALLTHVLADAEYWFETFRRRPNGDKRAPQNVRLLINPGRDEVLSVLRERRQWLETHRGSSDWNGGQINLAFAGHGTEQGNLVVADGELSPDEIMEAVAPPRPYSPARRLSLILDSCFSGLTIARMIVNPLHWSHVTLVDAFAAALYDEPAWELDNLDTGH